MVHYDACNTIRRANQHHPDLFDAGTLPTLSKDLISTADSLRSQLAKNALITLEELYISQGKAFDNQIETMMPCLLKKASDTNAFISDVGRSALTALCLNCSEGKIYNGLSNFVQ